ncbi:DUF2314 domain-containing protein [Sphingomonas sp.]|uniref:DUF2314 domain-containing protein n=1 Tax=Sphingomonas sp. TaxID=28214 RepID=UPI002ED7907C
MISAANRKRTRPGRPAALKRRPTAWLCHAAASLLAAPLPAQAQDATIAVAANDPQMRAAIAQAKRGLPVFFGHATSPAPGETRFMIKYDLVPEEKAEFVWAEILSHRGDVTIARLLNAPADRRWKRGDQVTIRDGQIIDWAYFQDSEMQGGGTMRVLIARMDPAEAREMLSRLGW